MAGAARASDEGPTSFGRLQRAEPPKRERLIVGSVTHDQHTLGKNTARRTRCIVSSCQGPRRITTTSVATTITTTSTGSSASTTTATCASASARKLQVLVRVQVLL